MSSAFVRLLTVAIVAGLVGMTGCSMMQQVEEDPPEETADEEAVEVAEADTETDTTIVRESTTEWVELDPRVVRLYTLEAELAMAEEEDHRGLILNQAMSRLQTLLDEAPELMQEEEFRLVYRGLLDEYRTYQGYGTADTLQTAHGDIFSVRADLTEALDPSAPEEPEPTVEERAEAEEFAVPMPINSRVEESLAFLQEEPERHLEHWKQRAGVYFPMIEHILEEEGVPDELKHLAVIESSLNPEARSWAGAVGMWQFMSHTGRLYDLQVNNWVDERRDPEKATRAAAEHLQDLYEEFGDWHLVLAAYNCGSGCVRRAMRQSGEDTYWDIYNYLPRETRGFVPMFIAATQVMSNSDAYEVPDVEPGSAFAYDYVAVRGSMMSLDTVADLVDTDVETIQELNPELRRSMVPPSRGYYHLRIPLGTYEQFARGYAQLPDEEKRPATTYTVRRGDTLSEIAARYGTTTRTIMQQNGLGSTSIRPGQQLAVPVDDYNSALAEQGADERPMRVQYVAPYPMQTLDPVGGADQLQADAGEEGPPVQQARYDSPGTASLVEEESEGTAANPSSETQTSEETAEETAPSTYRVQPGDTLSEIAARYDASTADLRRWNGLSSNRIYPGQDIQVTSEDAEAARTYRVQHGDTLGSIAQQHDVTVHQLREWNDLAGSRIYPGQELQVDS